MTNTLSDELRGDADAVVRDGERAIRRPRSPLPGSQSIDDPRRVAVAMELDRVADQVLPQHGQQVGSPSTVGSGSVGAARSRRRTPRSAMDEVVECRRPAPRRGRPRSARRCSRPTRENVSRSLISTCMRLAPSTANADVLDAALVELVAVPLLQQLAERGDLAQRLLQIVRGDVGELLEFGVGPPQIRRSARPVAVLADPGWPRVRRRSAAACSRRRRRSTGCPWGPCGTIRSPKLPSVMRRHAAASVVQRTGDRAAHHDRQRDAEADERDHHGDEQPRRASAGSGRDARFRRSARPRRCFVLARRKALGGCRIRPCRGQSRLRSIAPRRHLGRRSAMRGSAIRRPPRRRALLDRVEVGEQFGMSRRPARGRSAAASFSASCPA